MGGATLSIEAIQIHNYTRGFKLTGQLGDVMKESAEIAYSYTCREAGKFGATAFLKTLFTFTMSRRRNTGKMAPVLELRWCRLSLAKNLEVPQNIAMTGELIDRRCVVRGVAFVKK
ncbi:MAG: S16 family serine protease [Thiotrichaceae bacterium]